MENMSSRAGTKKKKKKSNKMSFKSKYRENEKESEFVCNQCEYSTDCMGRMNAHLICHSNRRPFVCQYSKCGQSFKRQQSLKRHIRTLHLNERLYCCHLCRKRFSQSQSLNDHLFCHLDNKSFKCLVDGCDKVFQTPKYLKTHQNRRHLGLTVGSNAVTPQQITQLLDSMKAGATEESMKNKISLKSMAEPNTSLSTNTNIANVCPPEELVCVVSGCGQSFRLQRSLRSHYKFSHSNQFNKSADISYLLTKTVKNICINDSKPNLAIVESIDDTYSPLSSDVVLTNGDIQAIDKISNNTYQFECNFSKCYYKTKSFYKIGEHFETHWNTTLDKH